MAFIRVGTLDDPDQCPPEVCIFTSSKQPWVTLPKNVPAFDEIYVPSEFWPPASMKRMVKARGPRWG